MVRAAALILLVAVRPILADDYAAPGGGLMAKVGTAAPPSCESVVEISAGSSVIGRESYASDNHDNGSCVAHAGWSPDSKFFVFSLQNSGGHQPWDSPIVVFSVEKKSFIDLEDVDSAITDPNFTLSAPSLLEYEMTKLPVDENKPKRQRFDLKALRG